MSISPQAAIRVVRLSILFLLASCGPNPAPPQAPPPSARETLPLPPGIPEPVPPAPGAPDDGKRWIQKYSAGIAAGASFKDCVAAAAADVPGLKPAAAAEANTQTLQFDTDLAAGFPGLVVRISPGAGHSADIEYVGHGFREPDQARQAIAPQLRALGEAVTSACKAS